MKKAIVILFLLSTACGLRAQETDSLQKQAAEFSAHTNATVEVLPEKSSTSNDREKITVPVYFQLLATDLKQAFTTPLHMKGSDWAATGKFALVAGGLAFFDEPIQKAASRWYQQDGTLRGISRQVTNLGGPYETYILAGLGAYGFLFKKQKLKNATLLATQAFITSSAIGKLVKSMTNRQRPFFADSIFLEAEPTFYGPFNKGSMPNSPKRTNSSFPSGHTTVAFAVATVFAMEYRDKPLIPILAYSTATLVGLSRLSENKHWTTDVLTGAALGWLSGRLVVNNFHRLVHKKELQPGKSSLHFNLGYNQGRATAGLVYNF